MHHLRRDRADRRWRATGPAIDLHVAKALPREMRMPRLAALARQRHAVGLEAVLEVVMRIAVVDRAIGQQFLAVVQHQRVAGLPCALRVAQPAITRGKANTYTPGCGSVTAVACRVCATRIGGSRCACSTPFGAGITAAGRQWRSSKAGRIEAGLSAARVVGLAAVDVVEQGRAVVQFPVRPGAELLALAAVVAQPQQRAHARLAVPGRLLPMPDIGIGQAIEAAPEFDADRVARSGLQQAGDVVRHVKHALVVVGEVGRKHRGRPPACR